MINILISGALGKMGKKVFDVDKILLWVKILIASVPAAIIGMVCVLVLLENHLSGTIILSKLSQAKKQCLPRQATPLGTINSLSVLKATSISISKTAEKIIL